MGGWTGSGEERDNKAGGDVNSQIGSFSCFPQPATLDGWLRQRPERIRETQAPPEGWGSGGGGGGGGRWSRAGVCGEGTPEGCKERNGPRKLATPGEIEGKLHTLFTCLPSLQLIGAETAPEGGEQGCMSPRGYKVRKDFAREVRDARGEMSRRLWLQIPPLSSFPPRFSGFRSHTLPLSSFPSFLLAPSCPLSLCLFSHCFSPASSPPLPVTPADVVGSAWVRCLLWTPSECI